MYRTTFVAFLTWVVAVSPNVTSSSAQDKETNPKTAANAQKIVGKWIIIKAGTEELPKDVELAIEFTSDGKVKIYGPEGEEGTYRVDEDRFVMTLKNSGKTVKSRIKALTADMFVFEDDSKGKTVVIEMKKKK